MQTRQIPGTDLHVSLLCFGNFTFGTGWWGEFTDAEGIALQNEAFDHGVNFFDTAPTYGNGRAEMLLADTIQHAGRDNIVVTTKFGYDIYADPGDGKSHREKKQNFSASFIRKDLEQSLQRMKIDCVDLYQAHNVKLPQYSDELFEAMDTLRDQGKIRYWGVALGPAIGWREEGYEALINRGAHTVQTVLNMYEQDPGREFCQIADQLGRGGIIARVPTNSGILDEEFTSPDHVFPQHDHRKFRDRHWLVYGLKKNEIMRPIAEQLGLTIRQLAFKWLAAQPAMVSIEPNILSMADVTPFVEAMDKPDLPQDVLDRITRLYDSDFDLGTDAHPCDWKSSVTEDGSIRSGYVEPDIENWRTPQVVPA